MLIDWFTVVAQAINFLVLVWFLKRFLYAPVLRAISEREQRVASQLRDAEAKQAEARKERDEFQRKNEELELQRAGLLQKAADEAGAKRTALLNAARAECEAFRARLQQTIVDERESLNRQVATRAQQEIFTIARKVLAELANATLEERITAVFVNKLRGMGADEKAAIIAIAKASPRPVIIRSAFDLPPAQHKAVEQVVNETLGTVQGIRFETSPDAVSGIELQTDGHKIAWSIAEYLKSLEQAMGDVLDDSSGHDAA